jgi:hypothetical protein
MQLDRIPRITQDAGALDSVGRVVERHAGKGAVVLLVADPGLSPWGSQPGRKRR